MGQARERLATWEDLLATPDDGQLWEVLAGSLEAQPRPGPAHNRAQAGLAGRLWDPFDSGRGGPGGWWLLIEPDVRLAPHAIVVPDLAGWRREHLADLPDSRPIDVALDWVCEVLSPGDPSRDRVRKAGLYLENGVPFFWILDPGGRTLEAFEARSGSWVRLGAWTDGEAPRVPPFEAIEMDLTSLLTPRSRSDD